MSTMFIISSVIVFIFGMACGIATRYYVGERQKHMNSILGTFEWILYLRKYCRFWV